ncbi:hypothetical protein QYE76_043569 [Lolium multiflorum]|uniref:RNase H type-1 domain-containing protein n=1 Tax=Lolium multiflorum TaxID=4521 RepID=A0AAD8TJE4_LOLMU|nr:hypothetical protein QYE76_043569 [Lolium multiflorum]
MQILGLGLEAHGGKYLGLPLYVGRSKARCFEYLKEKIWKCIQGCKERFLSAAGKEILIKAVAQAITTYAMACFDLTKSLCDSISQLVCQYWWSQQDNESRMHWVGWEKMKLPKDEGGLGFRDLHSFNMAMLARQGWRIIQAPDSLCSRVLRAKYFPNGNILTAVDVPGMSYVWRSILKGMQLLKEGLIWRVGDGSQISIWSDPWLPMGPKRTPSSRQPNNLITKVSELIDPVSGCWDNQLVRQTFCASKAADILSIPIVDETDDFLAWHLDNRGIFTVKSACKLHINLLLHQSRSASCSDEINSEWKHRVWKQIWKLECPPKVQHFLWRFGHNSHPLHMNIARRGVELDTRQPPRWNPPPTDVVKINTDGSFLASMNTRGWGAIARDHLGVPVFAACGFIPDAADALQAELTALIQAIPVAEQMGLCHVIFSTNCTELKQGIDTNSYDLSRLGPLFKHAKFLLRMAFVSCSVEYCPRACNSPAHKLAALGGVFSQGSPGLWFDDFPPDVMSSVTNDFVMP